MPELPDSLDPAELRSHAFDAFPSEVAILDRDGTILETNGRWDSFAEENGSSLHQDMVGENYLTVCDADDDPSATEAARGIRAVIDGTQDAFSFEYPCHTPDERHWFMMRVRPVEYEGRHVVLVIHTDITERREAELAVEERNDQLELLTGILGHDLRNPMNVAMGRAELLEGDDEQVATIRSSIERMNAIIEDALLLARGTDVETVGPVSIETVAQDAWSHVETADGTLQVAATEGIEADESLVNQLLENLFRNTIESAGEGATVVVGPLDDGRGFFVADDGPGVPAYQRDEVFDAGYTTNQDDGGTGLGLAIVDRIVEAHGWDVDLMAREDGGARFEFSGVTSVK